MSQSNRITTEHHWLVLMHRPIKGLPGVECHTRRTGITLHSIRWSSRSVEEISMSHD